MKLSLANWLGGSAYAPYSANLRYLTQTPLLEEMYVPRVIRAALLSFSVAILLFIVWASFTMVNETAKAKGDVVPSGYVQIVQHLEGGIIREILVKEGEFVSQGQLLLRLDGAGTDKDLSELEARQMALKLQAERLRAFVENRAPSFGSVPNADSTAIAEQQRIFDSMMDARGKESDVLKNQIIQKQQEHEALQKRLTTVEQSIRLVREARDIQKSLHEKGLTSRFRYLEKEEALNALMGDKQQVISNIGRAAEQITEYENRLASLSARNQDESWQQLDQMESEIAQNQEMISKYASRVERLEVRAPVDGLVKGLEVNTIGGVIAAGQKLMEIVPYNQQLVVEVRIRPGDVGHMSIGQPVQVKVHAFDYARYGSIQGSLEFLSATTFLDETGKSYYRGRVRLQRNYAGSDPQQNIIMPGMTVDADIVTGSKSIIAYLLKPIHNAAATAFTER